MESSHRRHRKLEELPIESSEQCSIFDYLTWESDGQMIFLLVFAALFLRFWKPLAICRKWCPNLAGQCANLCNLLSLLSFPQRKAAKRAIGKSDNQSNVNRTDGTVEIRYDIRWKYKQDLDILITAIVIKNKINMYSTN